MIDIFFVLIATLIGIVLLLIFRHVRSAFNPFYVMSASTYLFSVIGSLLMYFELDPYRVELGVVNKDILSAVFVIGCVSVLTFFSFGKLVDPLFVSFDRFDENVFTRKLAWTRLGLVFGFLISLCILIFVYPYPSEWPISVLFLDGFEASAAARSQITNERSSAGVLLLVFNALNLILTTAAIRNLNYYKTGLTKLLSLLFLVYVAFTQVITTEKAPLVVFLAYAVLWYLAFRNGSVAKVPVAKLAFIASATFVGLHMLTYGYDFQKSIYATYSRLFTGSAQPAYHYLEIFPQYVPYFEWSSFPNPMGIFDFESISISVFVMDFLFPDSSVVGSMPAVFWAEGYANFGFVGIVMSFVLVIFVLLFYMMLSNLLLSRDMRYVFLLALSFRFMNVGITGVSGFIIDLYLLVFFMICFAIGLFPLNKRGKES